MSRHAYLIMAHSEVELLKLLLHALDYPENDIYLHIDKKVQLLKNSEASDIIKLGNIHIFRKYSVGWGGDAQIKCELFLLNEAIKTTHSYYHFISGVDIPLLKQCDVHAFFDKDIHMNYIALNEKACAAQDFLYRIRYFRFFQNVIGRVTPSSHVYIRIIEKIGGCILKAQQLISVNRIRTNPYTLYKGSSWFSITHECALYLCNHKKDIIRYFGHSIGADEIFLQTMVMNSEHADTVCLNNLRYIDWSESDLPGAPKTLCMSDYDSIIKSGKIFARKFSFLKDEEVIRKLYSRLEP